MRSSAPYSQCRIAKTVDPDGAGSAPAETERYVHDYSAPPVVPGMFSEMPLEDMLILLEDDSLGTPKLKERYLNGPAVDQVFAAEAIDSTGTPTETYWYLHDHQGSTRSVLVYDPVTDTNTRVQDLSYDAYGNVVSNSNTSLETRFLFTGREYDAATGLYYYRARYYDPRIGRFVNLDPLGFAAGDANPYRYVFNDMLNLNDPSGLTPIPAGPPQGFNAIWEAEDQTWVYGDPRSGQAGGQPNPCDSPFEIDTLYRQVVTPAGEFEVFDFKITPRVAKVDVNFDTYYGSMGGVAVSGPSIDKFLINPLSPNTWHPATTGLLAGLPSILPPRDPYDLLFGNYPYPAFPSGGLDDPLPPSWWDQRSPHHPGDAGDILGSVGKVWAAGLGAEYDFKYTAPELVGRWPRGWPEWRRIIDIGGIAGAVGSVGFAGSYWLHARDSIPVQAYDLVMTKLKYRREVVTDVFTTRLSSCVLGLSHEVSFSSNRINSVYLGSVTYARTLEAPPGQRDTTLQWGVAGSYNPFLFLPPGAGGLPEGSYGSPGRPLWSIKSEFRIDF